MFNRGISSKGKPLIKLTKNKIDVLRRKRNATIRFLKKDLADLISNGLDDNAYSRAGGLLDELRHLWNLDFVEQTCDFVYKNLSTMQKIPECPEECREAVSSLMFAASGFSELPELRELRQMFHERYGDSLVLFVNQELVESMSSKPFSSEKKVKLMEDVALEFSIRWDPKAFEKRIARHTSSSVKETPKSTFDKYKLVDRNMALPKREVQASKDKHEPIFTGGDTIVMKVKRENQHEITPKERWDNVRRSSRSESKENKADRKEFHMQSKQESSRERHEPIFNEGDTIVMKIKRENGHGDADARPKKTEVIASEKLKLSSTKIPDKLVIGFKQESFFQGYKNEIHEEHAPPKAEDNISRPPKPSSKSKRPESFDSLPRHRSYPESKDNAVLVGESTEKELSGGLERMKSQIYKSLPPPYVKHSSKPKNEKAEASVHLKARSDGEEGNHRENDKNVVKVERGNEADHDVDSQSLKRRSSRRKHVSQSGDGDDDTRSRRKENSRKGLQVLIDDDVKDSEEMMMDKLLMHYSKKPSSYEDKRDSKSRRSHLKKPECEEMMIQQPARSRSLPSEQFSGPSEPAKTFARASSFQPERSSEAKHVHPKLPNYDDLAARFAELKGR